MKTYEFIEESFYVSNGCDCYEQALILEGIIDEDLDFDYNEVDFELMCQTYGIKVIIHRDED